MEYTMYLNINSPLYVNVAPFTAPDPNVPLPRRPSTVHRRKDETQTGAAVQQVQSGDHRDAVMQDRANH